MVTMFVSWMAMLSKNPAEFTSDGFVYWGTTVVDIAICILVSKMI